MSRSNTPQASNRARDQTESHAAVSPVGSNRRTTIWSLCGANNIGSMVVDRSEPEGLLIIIEQSDVAEMPIRVGRQCAKRIQEPDPARHHQRTTTHPMPGAPPRQSTSRVSHSATCRLRITTQHYARPSAPTRSKRSLCRNTPLLVLQDLRPARRNAVLVEQPVREMLCDKQIRPTLTDRRRSRRRELHDDRDTPIFRFNVSRKLWMLPCAEDPGGAPAIAAIAKRE